MWIAICAGWILASIFFYICLIYSAKEISAEDVLEDTSGDYIESLYSDSTINTTSKAA